MKDSLKKVRMDEQELVRQIQEGDEMAFAEIVKIYKDKIVNFLCKLTGDYQKAVDLSQETFMRVYFKAHKYRPVAPLSSWIYAIASNLAKTEMKKMRKYAVISLDEVQNRVPIEAYRKSIGLSPSPLQNTSDSQRYRRLLSGRNCSDHEKARRYHKSKDQSRKKLFKNRIRESLRRGKFF
jgi:RNA polymerase sigma factor (sigma-70 family)